MDTAWIKVIVLTLAECVAPEGKTVCQEQEVQYYFFDEVECQQVLEQLIDYRDTFENVIVNKQDSSCQAAARNLQVFDSRADADRYFTDTEGLGVLSDEPAPKDFMRERHDKRLATLPVCDDQNLVTPCRRGDIIIEGVDQKKTEIWKQSQKASRNQAVEY
ncbi:MAG: hypothetical protein ACE5FV_13315 [Woeseia sp.]